MTDKHDMSSENKGMAPAAASLLDRYESGLARAVEAFGHHKLDRIGRQPEARRLLRDVRFYRAVFDRDPAYFARLVLNEFGRNGPYGPLIEMTIRDGERLGEKERAVA